MEIVGKDRLVGFLGKNVVRARKVTVGRVKRMIRYNTAKWKSFAVIAASFCFFLEILRWVRSSELNLNISKFLNFSCSQEFGTKIDQREIL